MSSEAEICGAIDALAGRPGVFEKLVGRWICTAPEFGDRFHGLQIRGRKGEQTVKGWPDAFVERPNGEWDCVEATFSPRWKAHLTEDLRHVRAARVCGFVLVAWCHGPRDQHELNAARADLVAAGVPEDRIDFVFKGRLLDSLQDRRCAHLWRGVLGLSQSTYPFRLVDSARGLIGIDAGSEALQPRPQEFRDGLVHRPSILSAVVEQLRVEGVAEVRGRGAAGKTVLAEHVAQAHLREGAPRILHDSDADGIADELPEAGSVYYLKLGSFEKGEVEMNPAAAFRRHAAENALFIVDDVHLNPQAALDLINEWRDDSCGSKMLCLGRQRDVFEGQGENRYEEMPTALELLVGAGDLVGVYRRLALIHEGVEEPELPPAAVVQDWLDLFRGDLVVFSVAVAARLRPLLRGEWELTEADAALEVQKRYLPQDLNLEERRDLLGLATLAAYELGAPVGVVASGMPRSERNGAVVKLRLGAGDSGEFQLAHPGLGKLLLAAAGGGEGARDVNEWARADSVLALRLGAELWCSGENVRATQALSSALGGPGELGAALVALPEATGVLAITGFDALDLLSPPDLDQRLVGEVDRMLTSLLDRPGRLTAALGMLGRSCPQTSERLLEMLRDEAVLDTLLDHLARSEARVAARQLYTWMERSPELGLALGRRLRDVGAFTRLVEQADDLAGLFSSVPMGHLLGISPAPQATVEAMLELDPFIARRICEKVLAGAFASIPKASRVLRELSPVLYEELCRQALNDPFRERLSAHVEGVAPSQLVALFRFAERIDTRLVPVVEAAISPADRQRLIERLMDEPQALLGAAYSRQIAPLLGDLIREAEALGAEVPTRDVPRRPNPRRPSAVWWQLAHDPSQAVFLQLNSVVGFVNSEHRFEPARSAAERVTRELLSNDNRARLVRAASVLPPAELCVFLRWAAIAPEIGQSLAAHFREDANLAIFADVCVDCGVFEHLVGVLDALGEIDNALPSRLIALMVDSERLRRLTEAGFRGPPTGWAALFRREDLAHAVLGAVDERRWRHYWRSRRSEDGIGWLWPLQSGLSSRGYPELCDAPAERVLTSSSAADWNGETTTLGHLANALSRGRALEEGVALTFLQRIDYMSFLASNYRKAGLWAIAHFLNSLHRHQAPSVVDAVITDPLARRVQSEVETGWSPRSDSEIAGLLALVGSLDRVGIPTFLMPPSPLQTLDALKTVATPKGQLTPGHAMVWAGLELLISQAETPLALGPGPVLDEQLRLFREAEPEDPSSVEANARVAAWIERGLEDGGVLTPPDPV